MGSRHNDANNPWPRRSVGSPHVASGGSDTVGPQEITRISQRVREIERMLLGPRRQAPSNDPSIPNPNITEGIRTPASVPAQSANSIISPLISHDQFSGSPNPNNF